MHKQSTPLVKHFLLYKMREINAFVKKDPEIENAQGLFHCIDNRGEKDVFVR